MLRPIIEFCHVIYHSMLTDELSAKLEGLQKISLRVIYGFNNTYEGLLNLSGLETLKKRRNDAFLRFAKNLAGSERYAMWFPERKKDRTDIEKRTNISRIILKN